MPATPEALFARFDELGIAVRRHRHPPLHTVADSRASRGDLPGGHCKSLFLKDKARRLWLVVALEDRVLDLKGLGRRLGARKPLSFARPDQLEAVLGVKPGSVTPFAVINASAREVEVVLDRDMLAYDPLNYHPLNNVETTSIAPGDLLKFLRACGHEPKILDFDAGTETEPG